jgi:hypothetical protein
MDQDASNKDAYPLSRTIPQPSSEEQRGADTNMDQATTPEAETHIDLPYLSRTESMVDTNGKRIGMEIPDSEEASEMSSPVKLVMGDAEDCDEGAEQDGELQTAQEVSKQDFEQRKMPKSQEEVARAEIPESKEATKFSSPVLVDVRGGISHVGSVPVDGELKIGGDEGEEHVETRDTTMMDVFVPALEETTAGVSRDTTWVEAKMSDIGKEMTRTIGEDDGLQSTVDMDSAVGQATLQEDTLSTDTTLYLDKTVTSEQGMQPVTVNGEISSSQITLVKGNLGAMELLTKPYAQTPLEYPGTVGKHIALTARQLLGELSCWWQLYILCSWFANIPQQVKYLQQSLTPATQN